MMLMRRYVVASLGLLMTMMMIKMMVDMMKMKDDEDDEDDDENIAGTLFPCHLLFLSPYPACKSLFYPTTNCLNKYKYNYKYNPTTKKKKKTLSESVLYPKH